MKKRLLAAIMVFVVICPFWVLANEESVIAARDSIKASEVVSYMNAQVNQPNNYVNYCLSYVVQMWVNMGFPGTYNWGTAANFASQNTVSTSRANIPVGADVFFTSPDGNGHIGIHVGDGYFVHAGNKDKIEKSNISETYWSARYTGWGWHPNVTVINDSTPTGTQTILDGRYQIVSKLNTNKIIDVHGASKNDTANIQLYGSRYDEKQTWDIAYLGDGSYKIINHNSGKALEAAGAGTENGTNIRQYSWNETKAQKWVIRANSDGSFSLESQCAPGKFIDVLNGGTEDGTNIQLWENNSNDAQKFYFVEWAGKTIPDGQYDIVTTLDCSKNIDVSGVSKEDCANIYIYSSRSEEKQTWDITYLGDGSYKILNHNSGKALEAAGAATENGTNIRQYSWNGTNAQKWTIKKNSDGSYSFISWLCGRAVDVLNGGTENGTNVQLWENSGARAQQFYLVEWTGQTIPDGKYDIATVLDCSKNLEVYGASKDDTANVQLYGSRSDEKQTWDITYLGDGSYKIINHNSGKALEAAGAGTANGTNIRQYSCNGTYAQKWAIKKNQDGSYSFISWLCGKAVDVLNGGTENGTNVQLWENSGARAQQFFLVEWAGQTIKDGKYRIVTKLDETKSIEVADASKEDSANIQLNTSATDNKQAWEITYLGDGSYKIINSNSEMALEVAGAGVANGTNIRQYSWNGTNAQKWIIKKNTDDSYSIVSWLCGKFLDVLNGGTEDGTNIQQWSSRDDNAQKFFLNKWVQLHKHSIKHTPAKAKSCTEDGNIEYWSCSECEMLFSDATGEHEITQEETIIKAGHIWNTSYSVDKTATCKEEGSESIHCSVCGQIKEGSSKTISKKNHNYGAWKTTKEATCTASGSKEKTCSVCKDKVTETIPAKSHSWKTSYTVDTPSTCIKEGSESIHCSVCGTIQEGSSRSISIDKSAHNYGSWTKTKKQTCTEAGSKERVCTLCRNKETETIPASGHNWNKKYTIDTQATCLSEGSKSIHCTVCDAIQEGSSREVKVTEHCWDNGKVTTAATKTTTGIKTFTCAVCGKTKTETIPKLTIKKNPLKIKVSKKVYKQSKLVKSKTFKIGVKKAQGKVAYTLNKKAKKAGIKVSKKGKVTIPKNCKKGTYRITVKAAGNQNYKAGTKTVTIKIK